MTPEDDVGPTQPRLPAAHSRKLVGQVVDGYRILSLLGEGGMGRVYKGFDTRLGRPVAIKVIADRDGASEALRERFAREIRALSSLNHPHVAQIYSAGEIGGMPYYAMEYIDGLSLDRWLTAGRRLAGRRCLGYLIDAAEGLAAAYRQGLVHRDVKPSNLMIDAEDRLKVVDFGIARRLGDDSALTRTGSVPGTPNYMSPEQILGGELDHRSDIYSLGATFYHLFAGARPFTGTDPAMVRRQHLQESLVPLCERNPLVPAAVGTVIDTMLAKEPSERYASYEELIEDLERARHGGGPASDPATRRAVLGPEPPPEGRARAGAWLYLAVVVVALGLLWWGRGGGEHAVQAEASRPGPGAASGERRDERRPTVASRIGEVLDYAVSTKSLANLRRLSVAVESYAAETGGYPDSLATVVEAFELHPKALVDGWERPIRYRRQDPDHFRLISTGADGEEGTDDDLVLEDGFVVQGVAGRPSWLTEPPTPDRSGPAVD